MKASRLRVVARNIEPLAAWLEQNRPSVSSISLPTIDIDCIREHPEDAQRIGFITGVGGEIYYRKFMIRSVRGSP